ncbi:MAG: hypothetical protein Q9227_004072 [Pyrenula ochraceoflavens]
MYLPTALFHLLLLSLLPSPTFSLSLTLHLPSSSSPQSLPPSTHATLRPVSQSQSQPRPFDLLTARLRRDNTLRFPDLSLTPGSYLLDVYSKEAVFAPMRVDVASDAASQSGSGKVEGVWETFWGGEWGDKGGLLSGDAAEDGGEVRVEVKMLARRGFYEERGGLDPELRAEFEEQQKNSPLAGLSKAVQGQGAGGAAGGFDLASWMAGAQSQSQQPQQQGGGEATGQDAKGGGSARRR